MPKHHERAHSKFSASGAERWFNCPGSVELSEGLPDISSSYAQEGTRAHEVLETLLVDAITNEKPMLGKMASAWSWKGEKPDPMMINHGVDTANFMLRLQRQNPGSELIIETRVYLDFIHPEMFGTFDGGLINWFDTLHVLDYKYGAGHSVSPKKNLQMIFYGIGLAHKYHWNFKKVRFWIIQPRIKGYDGPTFWEIPIAELERYMVQFKIAVDRVLKEPNSFAEGPWCHWCKAHKVCPLKRKTRLAKAKERFQIENPERKDGKQKENVQAKKGKDKKEESRQEEKSESKNRSNFKTQEDENFENEIEALDFQEREDAGEFDFG